jgi:iron complex outermembrane recepter protein
MYKKLLTVLAMTSVLATPPSWVVAASSEDSSDLLNLSLQQLSDIEVTSVSKRSEKASQAAAAIYVITQEDIRRSGMQNVPELLRMVPGLQVARAGAQNWAITSRGFNGQFANKLLVLIDGRTVYSPVFAGVFWDVQNLLMEDIERIEVIRGPGATLWGANAVNGVINIITKNAKDTQGKLATASVGTQSRAKVGGRYGGNDGDLSYRTYAQYLNNDEEKLLSGADAEDQWSNMQGGFRLDWNTSEKEQKTIQGDVYKGNEGARRYLPVTAAISSNFEREVNDKDGVSGANILGRWKRELSKGSDVTFQTYYDLVNRENISGKGHTQTVDMEFQHNLVLNARNDITWGLGYRYISSGFTNSFYIAYAPEDFNTNLFSGFIQDKVTLIPEELFFTFGTKLEHNGFSGLEYEPSARISWTPTSNQTIWAAASRAVHAKTQSDENLRLILAAIPTPSPFNAIADTTLLAAEGNAATKSEEVLAYELGYRIQPVDNVSVDVTGFVNQYRHLASLVLGSAEFRNDPLLGNYFYQPLISRNDNRGETHGFEAAATWEVNPKFKLSGGYTLFYSNLHITGESLVTAKGTAPTQQFNMRSYMDLPHDLQLDTMLYVVDPLPGLGVRSYTRLDTRLGWIPTQGLDLSLIGQNLLERDHQEYSGFLYQRAERIGRSVVARATARF